MLICDIKEAFFTKYILLACVSLELAKLDKSRIHFALPTFVRQFILFFCDILDVNSLNHQKNID